MAKSGGGKNLLRVRSEFDDKISSPLGKLRDKFDQFGKNKGAKAVLMGVGLSAGTAAFGLLDRAMSGVVDMAGSAIRNASDLNETLSKSSVIFGDNAGEIAAWGKTMAQAGGLSQKAALDVASGFAGLFQTVGLAADESADMAKRLTEMGSDLASFFNTDVESALAALKSGLAGESEPMRKFNVFLSETAVTAKLAQMGIKKVGGAFTEAQKATARYALIMEQTGAAQGDYARTADGLANSSRGLAAEMENLSAEVGQELLPVMVDLTKWARDDGVPALRELIDVVKNSGDAVRILEGIATMGGSEIRRMSTDARDAAAAQEAMAAAAGATTEVAKTSAREHQFAGRAIQGVGAALGGVAGPAGRASGALGLVGLSAAEAADDMKKFKDSLNDAIEAVIVAGFEPEQLALKLKITQGELKTASKELDTLTSKGKKTGDDWARIKELRLTVSEGKEEVLLLQTRLAGLDGLSLDEIKAAMKGLGTRANNAGDEVARLYRLINLVNTGSGMDGRSTANTQGRASGGPVQPGGTYTVGERGEETLVMGRTGGYVIPNGGGGGSGGGSQGHVHHTHVYLNGREIAEVVDRELYYAAARAPQSRYAG